MGKPATDVGDGSARTIAGVNAIPTLPPTPAAAVAAATRATVVKAPRPGEEDKLVFFLTGDDEAVALDFLRGEAGRLSPGAGVAMPTNFPFASP